MIITAQHISPRRVAVPLCEINVEHLAIFHSRELGKSEKILV